MRSIFGRPERGFTLIEVMVASLVTAVVAGGTMMAFATASRISRQRSSTAVAEGGDLAEQTLERLRNSVFDGSSLFIPANLDHWISDPPPPGVGSEALSTGGPVKRCYFVKAQDCDRDGTPGDCYSVQVKVCWNGTACPAGC